jgi:hypothetical protein
MIPISLNWEFRGKSVRGAAIKIFSGYLPDCATDDYLWIK